MRCNGEHGRFPRPPLLSHLNLDDVRIHCVNSAQQVFPFLRDDISRIKISRLNPHALTDVEFWQFVGWNHSFEYKCLARRQHDEVPTCRQSRIRCVARGQRQPICTKRASTHAKNRIVGQEP